MVEQRQSFSVSLNPQGRGEGELQRPAEKQGRGQRHPDRFGFKAAIFTFQHSHSGEKEAAGAVLVSLRAVDIYIHQECVINNEFLSCPLVTSAQ